MTGILGMMNRITESSQCNEHTACAILGVASVKQLFHGGFIDALQDFLSSERRRWKDKVDEQVAKALVKHRFYSGKNKGIQKKLLSRLATEQVVRLATYIQIVEKVPKDILWAMAKGKLNTKEVDPRLLDKVTRDGPNVSDGVKKCVAAVLIDMAKRIHDTVVTLTTTESEWVFRGPWSKIDSGTFFADG